MPKCNKHFNTQFTMQSFFDSLYVSTKAVKHVLGRKRNISGRKKMSFSMEGERESPADCEKIAPDRHERECSVQSVELCDEVEQRGKTDFS